MHKFYTSQLETTQPYTKNLQHIPEKLLRGIQLTSLRTCDRQQKPSQRGRVLYRNSSQEENPSYIEDKHSKTHLICLHSGETGSHLLSAIQFIKTFKLHSKYHSQIIFPVENNSVSRLLTHYRNKCFYYLRHCHFSDTTGNK